ncbi:hypothetical protein SASPL_110268 [Salvia splendens]|uniref:Uncharacterized protein n=1 Tax=Salvia splendens TaxID=180675 RepID=A0A8X8Y7E3_SALSN|nr:hypothetical protein SASPL_110268 [Salvia splendens]
MGSFISRMVMERRLARSFAVSTAATRWLITGNGMNTKVVLVSADIFSWLTTNLVEFQVLIGNKDWTNVMALLSWYVCIIASAT